MASFVLACRDPDLSSLMSLICSCSRFDLLRLMRSDFLCIYYTLEKTAIVKGFLFRYRYHNGHGWDVCKDG